ncbi:MAG: hypothetical protein WDM70_04245 [Nitrosomonadales bacterium]
MAKKKIIHVCFLGIAIVSIALASFRFGTNWYRGKVEGNEGRRLDVVQGSLAFNEYKDFQEIGHLLAQKCYDQALSEVKYEEGIQRMLLAEYLLKRNDPELKKYVGDRDPEFLASDLNQTIASTSKSMVVVPCPSTVKSQHN